MKTPLTIITAASSNHFNCLRNLLFTAAHFEPEAKIVAYDIGLSEQERAAVEDAGEIRTFHFENYPAHFSMDQFAGRLAWRPVVVADALREFGGVVLWLDAGSWITRPLAQMRKIISDNGVYACTCGSTIGDRLYPSTHALFGATADLLAKPLRDAGVIGFSADSAPAMALADRWRDVAMDAAMMSPEGSDRRTHRQDAVFATLFYQAGFQSDARAIGEIAIKKDDVSFDEMKFRLNIVTP